MASIFVVERPVSGGITDFWRLRGGDDLTLNEVGKIQGVAADIEFKKHLSSRRRVGVFLANSAERIFRRVATLGPRSEIIRDGTRRRGQLTTYSWNSTVTEFVGVGIPGHTTRKNRLGVPKIVTLFDLAAQGKAVDVIRGIQE